MLGTRASRYRNGAILLSWVLLTAMAPMASAEAPTATTPFADVELTAGSGVIGAAVLSRHFSAPEEAAITFAIKALDGELPAQGDVVITLEEGRLDVAAPSTTWVGARTFQITACAGPMQTECLVGNAFTVHVVAPKFDLTLVDPANFQITEGRDGESGPLEFSIAVNGSGQFNGEPRWFLDGEPVGEGAALTLPEPRPGTHRLEVHFESDEGRVVLYRSFTVSVTPVTSSGAWLAWSAVAIAAIAVGSASRSRFRWPLITLIVWMVYSRSSSESILDHFRRGALHQIIKENPGIHFGELRRRAGIPHGSAVHHLNALERAGLIKSVASGGFTRFFTRVDQIDDESYHLSPADKHLLVAVNSRPGISLGDLALMLNRSRSNTSSAVTRLASMGFVRTQKARRRRLIFPRPASDREVEEVREHTSLP